MQVTLWVWMLPAVIKLRPFGCLYSGRAIFGNATYHYIRSLYKMWSDKTRYYILHDWSDKTRYSICTIDVHAFATPWWRHQMETFSALLALCAGNSPVPVNSPHKGQWRGALMFSLICVWINGWVNNREAGDLRRYRGHHDVTVMHGAHQRHLTGCPHTGNNGVSLVKGMAMWREKFSVCIVLHSRNPKTQMLN